MGTEYLDELARKLGTGKNSPCRKAIESILDRTKQECKDGIHADAYSAQETLIDRVRREPACQKPKRALKRRTHKRRQYKGRSK